MQTLTIGNIRQTFFDPDEPIEGYKKKTWQPPAEWGAYQVMGESTIKPRAPQDAGNLRFAGGAGAPGCMPSLFAVPYEVLYFPDVDKWINRLIRPCHGYDTALHQPDFNADDLCP